MNRKNRKVNFFERKIEEEKNTQISINSSMSFFIRALMVCLKNLKDEGEKTKNEELWVKSSISTAIIFC